MVGGITITAIRSQEVVIGLCRLIFMYLDVSGGIIHFLPALLTLLRSSYIRSTDVRYLSAAEEDEAHKDHENVVQEVITFLSLKPNHSYNYLVNKIRSLASSIMGGHDIFKMHIYISSNQSGSSLL